ncbi:class I SAM-dependent methyltransferase [bacterium]|nr:class I SAM-dependent methyltransferase [bacterium]
MMKYLVAFLLCGSLASAGDLMTAIDKSETMASVSNPDWQPTPQDQIEAALSLLDLGPDDILVDFGCGDARALLTAVEQYGCRGIGVEISPEQWRLAKSAIEQAGMSDQIDLILGDATKLTVKATAGYVYLWPETLEALSPKLQKLERFVSYQHAVPGLAMKREGECWAWPVREKKQTTPVVSKATVAKPEPAKTKMTTEWGITGYRTVKRCNGRQCWYEQQPVYGYKQVPVKTTSTAKATPAKPAVTYVAPQRSNVAYWGGRAYTGRVCNSRNCSMCASIQAQLGR